MYNNQIGVNPPPSVPDQKLLRSMSGQNLMTQNELNESFKNRHHLDGTLLRNTRNSTIQQTRSGEGIVLQPRIPQIFCKNDIVQ